MHRHQSLRELSRDHHLALRYAKRLVRLSTSDHNRLVMYWPDIRLRFSRYWAEALAPHFRLEEEQLPLEFLDASWMRQMLDDHRHISRLFRHLMSSRQPDLKVLRELGERLQAHARWEEQELFGALQERVPPGVLGELAACRALTEEHVTDIGWLPPDLSVE